MKKFISILTAAVFAFSIMTYAAEEYNDDSQELEEMIEHFSDDDAGGYIDTWLDSETQEIIIAATAAAINAETYIYEGSNEKAEALAKFAVLAAEGGREDEVPDIVSQNLNVGNTADTMLAAALLCTPYNGFPRTLNIMSAINSALNNMETQTDTASETSWEESTGEFILTLQIDSKVMTVNGIETEIDTAPVIIDGRTLVPIRAIIEAMGGSVNWNDDTKTAELTYIENTIELTIDSTEAYFNGTASELDTAPSIIDGRTLLPIRFIAESFEFDVEWNGESRTITITKGL